LEKGMMPYPGPSHNACAGIDPIDQQRLREAAEWLIDARGVFMAVMDTIGAAVVSVGGSATRFLKEKLGIDLADRAEKITETTLWRLQSGAMLGLDPENRREPWDWFHKLVAGVSGATAGFVGEPGLLWDLPLTTGIIMRSVAEIARSFPNEDISSDDTKRACIEVFAFSGLGSRDEEADVGYWAARASLSHTTIEGLIRGVASRFGILLTDKMVGQVIPIAGAVAVLESTISLSTTSSRWHACISPYERSSGGHLTQPQFAHASASSFGRRVILDGVVEQRGSRSKIGSWTIASRIKAEHQH
jgi:hypothetical protein